MPEQCGTRPGQPRQRQADCSIGCITIGTRSGPASPTAPTCATQTGHDPDEALLRHRHTPCQTRTRHGPQVARASSTDRCGSQTRTNPVRKPVRVMAATGAGAPDKENADADDRQTDRDRETRDLSRGPPQVVVWRIDAASGAQPHGHIQQSATARTAAWRRSDREGGVRTNSRTFSAARAGSRRNVIRPSGGLQSAGYSSLSLSLSLSLSDPNSKPNRPV